MNSPSHSAALRDGTVATEGGDLAHGLLIGLMIAIPMWMLIGVALTTAFQQGPVNGITSLAFMVAAVSEAILARHAFRILWLRFWRRLFPVFNRSAWNSAHPQRARARRPATPGTRAVSYLEEISGKRINSVQDLLGIVGAPPADVARKPKKSP